MCGPNDPDEKQMWCVAYLVSLHGMRTAPSGVERWIDQPKKDADTALAAYRERWGLERESA